MKQLLFLITIYVMTLHTSQSFAQTDADNFYKSRSVRIEKVSFQSQYKMAVVGNLMLPTDIPQGAKLPAIIVGHPMGAVKEQSANLYATKMAERGFITLLDMISPRALLFVTGDQAHSKEFSEDAYQKASQPKELYSVKGAGHVDLYDRTDLIPFDKLKAFFNEHLK